MKNAPATDRIPGNPTVHNLSSIAGVTVDVPLTGTDLLVLAAHIKASADATIASMKAANNLDDGTPPARLRLPAELSAILTTYADNTDATLLWLHTAYEVALDALYEARRAAGGDYRKATRGPRTTAPKVER